MLIFINVGIHGTEPFSTQKEELKQRNHVVGTPSRVIDHIERETLALDEIKYLVIDEADEMLNMGFINDVEEIIKALPAYRVTMVFSATLPKDVENHCHKYMENPRHIDIASSGITTASIKHHLIEVTPKGKITLLKDITVVENPDSCIFSAIRKIMWIRCFPN